MLKVNSLKISNFIRNKRNLPLYYECMEEDFLLARKGNSGEQALGEDTCTTEGLTDHHPHPRM